MLRTETLKIGATRAIKHATPFLSNFMVGAAATVVGGHFRRIRPVVTGKNKEVDNGVSIHAEESLVSKLRKHELLHRIIIMGEHGLPVAPCGSCRDALITYAAPDAKVLVALAEGKMEWLSLAGLRPQDFQRSTHIDSLTEDDLELTLFHHAMRLMQNKPYNPYTERLNASVVFTQDDEILAATTKEVAHFKPDLSVDLALGMADAHRSRQIEMFLSLRGQNEPLFPYGRERQKLIEAAQACGVDFPVIAARPDGRLYWSTPSLLLPHHFGPKDLLDPQILRRFI